MAKKTDKGSAKVGPKPTARTNVRSRKPTTHAEGKPVRGIRPGVRGPAKRPEEIHAEEIGADRVLVIPAVVPRANPQMPPAAGTYHPPTAQSQERSRNQKLNRQLQDLIREIGNEVVPGEQGWTRIIAVIRRLYHDAMTGKTQATAILLERGWGKVPTPIQMDMKAEVLEIMEATGLTQAEIASDPILKELMGNAIEGTWRDANAGTGESAEQALPGSETGVRQEAGRVSGGPADGDGSHASGE